MSRILGLLAVAVALLAPQLAHAGQGARVVVENRSGVPLEYEFSQARGLSWDTGIDSGSKGVVHKGQSQDLGYLEESTPAPSTSIRMTLRDASGTRRAITLLANSGAWRGQIEAEDGVMIAVSLDITHGRQDRILVRTYPGFRLNSWLGDLVGARPDLRQRRVADFALLGTHDTATYSYVVRSYRPDDAFVVTQSQSIYDQLSAGVRFLDFRLGMSDGKVAMYHGSYLLPVSFPEAMGQVNRFLNENPGEFVLLSLKRDDGDAKRIGEALTATGSQDLTAKFYLAADIPTYDQAKGKAVILNRGIPGLGGIAIDIADKARYASDGTNVAVQDAYSGLDLLLSSKATLVREFYDKCMRRGSDQNRNSRYRLNFLSMSLPKPPLVYSFDFNPILLESNFSSESWSGVFLVDSFDTRQLKAIAGNLIGSNYAW